MEYYYKVNDWDQIKAKDSQFIEIRNQKIPYSIFDNMPEKTHDPKLIGEELERVTQKLWKLQRE